LSMVTGLSIQPFTQVGDRQECEGKLRNSL
jgi:hypothetical protein